MAVPSPRPGAVRRALGLAAVSAVALLALLGDAPLCPFAAATHHPCPACGLTRATAALLRGDLRGAVALHPLVVVVSPVTIGFALFVAASYVAGGGDAANRALRSRRLAPVAAVLGAAAILVWIARFFGAFGGPAPV